MLSRKYHEHHTSAHSGRADEHGNHTGHSPEIFKQRFFTYLLLILYLEAMFQE